MAPDPLCSALGMFKGGESADGSGRWHAMARVMSLLAGLQVTRL